MSGIIRRHRKSIGSCWRKLNPGQQALLVLAHLRKGETFAELAAGFEVGTTTAWRYVNEAVALLAARTPKLRQAVRDAKKVGYAYVVLDGTLIAADRVAADRPSYSGKHKRHGMNLQVIASPAGDILWVSGALPGSVHDKNAEWIWGVLAELEAVGLVTLADKGYQGSTYAKIPYRGKNKPESQKQANRAHAKLRAPGERANAQLKTWKFSGRHPALLPMARRSARQSHPRFAGPRGISRMEKVHWLTRRLSASTPSSLAGLAAGPYMCLPYGMVASCASSSEASVSTSLRPAPIRVSRKASASDRGSLSSEGSGSAGGPDEFRGWRAGMATIEDAIQCILTTTRRLTIEATLML